MSNINLNQVELYPFTFGWVPGVCIYPMKTEDRVSSVGYKKRQKVKQNKD
jgi:hypothetical protein